MIGISWLDNIAYPGWINVEFLWGTLIWISILIIRQQSMRVVVIFYATSSVIKVWTQVVCIKEHKNNIHELAQITVSKKTFCVNLDVLKKEIHWLEC